MPAARLFVSVSAGMYFLLGGSPDLLVSVGRSDDGASGFSAGVRSKIPRTHEKACTTHTSPFMLCHWWWVQL